jgi:hypothetical protein
MPQIAALAFTDLILRSEVEDRASRRMVTGSELAVMLRDAVAHGSSA